MRPRTYKPNPKRLMWLDHRTGKGVTQPGQSVQAVIKTRRKTPTLDDLLDTAAHAGAEWIMVTGGTPKPPQGKAHWLDADTPGWTPTKHWRGDDPMGRFTNNLTGQKVDITLAGGWFGAAALSPIQARTAWTALTAYLRRVEPEMATPFMSPGLTGAMLWGHTVNNRPKGAAVFDPEPVDNFIAERIHQTSGQHHIEHLVAGPYASDHPDTLALVDPKKTPTIDTFAHSDGRFFYASLCAELGVGPAQELNREAASDLWLYSGSQGKYAKARYRVKFTVPDTWDHVGILGVQNEADRSSWYYPNRPGAVGETWADHRELLVAEKYGWSIEPLEAVRFTEKARPLDTFAERIKRLREAVATDSDKVEPVLIEAVMAALRNILLHGIGRFTMRNRLTTQVVDNIDDVPGDAESRQLENGKWEYLGRDELTDAEKTRYHPELAAQVWGWARAQVLDSKAANGHQAGALRVDPRTLLAIEGDAIYTTEIPPWSLPVTHGGGDDGNAGRIRLQGLLQGSMKTPATLIQRAALKKKAAAAGPSAAWEA